MAGVLYIFNMKYVTFEGSLSIFCVLLHNKYVQSFYQELLLGDMNSSGLSEWLFYLQSHYTGVCGGAVD
jgi:hypothetical protein